MNNKLKSMEIELGFWRKPLVKPKELFNFAFLTLEKKEVNKAKSYGKLILSEKAMEMLGYELGKSGQTIGFSYLIDDNKLILLNTNGKGLASPNISQVTMKGTFSNNKLYKKLIEVFELDEDKENHLQLNIPTENYTIEGQKLKAANLATINTEETEQKEDTVTEFEEAEKTFEQEAAEAADIIDAAIDDL